MKAPEEEISYAAICERRPIPHSYFNTYKEAEDFAKIEKPAYRPYYIVERVEHFEICGVVQVESEEEKLGIDIGDEVIGDTGRKGVVVDIVTNMGEIMLSLLMREHKVPQLVKASNYETKTGRYFPQIKEVMQQIKREAESMTYEDVYNEFCKKFPNAEVEDYRPAFKFYVPQLAIGIPNAIIVWLKDGSKVIYIAESEGEK